MTVNKHVIAKECNDCGNLRQGRPPFVASRHFPRFIGDIYPAIKVGVAYMDGCSNLRVCHAPQGDSQRQSCHNERRRVYKKPAAFWQGSYYYCPAIVCISFNHIRLIASASFSPSNLCPMSLGCNPSAKFSFPSGVLGLRSPSFQKSTDFRPHFSATTFSAS